MATVEGPIGEARIPEAVSIEQKKRTIDRLALLCLGIAPQECSEEVHALRIHLQKGGWSPEKDEAIMQSIVSLVKKGGTPLHTVLLEKLEGRPLEEAVAVIEQQTPSLGRYGLIRGRPGDRPIREMHEEWYLERALISEILQQTQEATDETTRKRLEVAALERCSRAANPRENETIVDQNPLTRGLTYHRDQPGTLLERVETLSASKLGLPPGDVMAIDSPRFVEMLCQAKTVDEMKDFMLQGLQIVLNDNPLKSVTMGLTASSFVKLIDCSKLFADVKTPEELKQRISKTRNALIEAARQWIEARPDKNDVYYIFRHVGEIPDQPTPEYMTDFICPVSFFAVTELYGQPLLLNLRISRREGNFVNVRAREAICGAGFTPPANNLYRPLLDVSGGYEALAREEHLPIPSLDTGGYEIHGVDTSLEMLLDRATVTDFRALSHEERAPPYQKALAATTVDLLRGLSEERVDQRLIEKRLSPLLEASLLRIHNAMSEAILRKGNMTEFLRQLDIIHEEIELLLSISSPYSDEEFAAVASKRLTEGADPVIPKEYEQPRVSLKTSGMRAIYSALASAAAQKNGQTSRTAVLKDNYYETQSLLDPKTNRMCSSCDVVDGDFFRTNPDAAFEQVHPPVDVFVCDFHHNIQEQRRSYRTEDVQGMILRMHEKGLFAHPCTVIIDTTINLEQSEDIRSLLKNETIKRLVSEGKLNIVLARSGQKFDMLGFDNYSGGVVTAINNGEAFRAFNERLLADDDQMRGINRQGLTHLMKYGGDGLDQYRLALVNNTRKLYRSLPKEMIHYEGSTYPVQFSSMEEEPMAVFLDIKASMPEVLESLVYRFFRMTYDESLPITYRPSFGFATTNLVAIGRIHSNRLNPGLDDEKQLLRYSEFFHEVHHVIDKVLQETKGQPQDEIAKKLVKAITEMEIPGYTPPPRSCTVWSVDNLDKAKKDLHVGSPTSIKNLDQVISLILQGTPPAGPIDVSGLCPEPLNPDDLEKVLRLLEYTLIETIDELDPDRQQAVLQDIINMQLVAGTTFQGGQYLIAPEFFVRQSAQDSKMVKAVKQSRSMKTFSQINGLFGEGSVYDRDEIKEYLFQGRTP